MIVSVRYDDGVVFHAALECPANVGWMNPSRHVWLYGPTKRRTVVRACALCNTFEKFKAKPFYAARKLRAALMYEDDIHMRGIK